MGKKGCVITEGTLFFDAPSLSMHGSVTHQRTSNDERRKGSWMGNLCAHITAGGCKRRWALAWRERLEGSVGYYEYAGELKELHDGQIIVEGRFVWLGRARGSFRFCLQSLHE